MDGVSSSDEALGTSLDDSFPFLIAPRFDKPICNAPDNTRQRKFSVKQLKIIRSEGGFGVTRDRSAEIKALWRAAYHSVLHAEDPWARFHLERFPAEQAKRYRYNALKASWVEDEVCVKIAPSAFGHGAMRECFRAKKQSNFAHSQTDWTHAGNFVAKRYIEPVARDVYFDDVCLQMDAKLWGEEYSRNPAVSKKVDIAQMCVIELVNRPDKPLYHLEHFIEGNYRKYNSNSGFVDAVARNTPQAFSHFTFERSGHRLLVVDIQGVGDLWTDPQLHTFDGKAYGDGNLGLRGMALFFHTHRCNPLCQSLGLDSFDLEPNEQRLSNLASAPTPSPESPRNDGNQLVIGNGGCDVARSNGRSVDSPQSPPNNTKPISFGETVAIPKRKRYYSGQHHHDNSSSLSSSLSRDGNGQVNNDHSLSSSLGINPSDFVDVEADFIGQSLPTDRLPYLPHDSPIVAQSMLLSATVNRTSRRKHTQSLSVSNELARLQLVDDGRQGDSNPLLHSQPNFPLLDSAGLGQSVPIAMNRPNNREGDGDVGKSPPLSCSSPPVNAISQSSLESELTSFFESHRIAQRSSSVAGVHLQDSDAFILGLIHHELARMHAYGRFVARHFSVASTSCLDNSAGGDDDDRGISLLQPNPDKPHINWVAVLFHEEQAASLQCFEAIECLSQYYLDLPVSGPLSECPSKPDPSESRLLGITYMSTAASAGDRASMCYLADLNYAGFELLPGQQRQEPDWLTAIHWYDKAIKLYADSTTGNEEDNPSAGRQLGFDSLTHRWPLHGLYAKMGEMYATGGYGLAKDYAKASELYECAGETATTAFLGIAMNYFERSIKLQEFLDD